MCVYYRGAFRTGIHYFQKMLNLRPRTGTVRHLCIAQGIYQDIYSFLHKLHLQETPSQDFIKCLKERIFDELNLYQQVSYSRFPDVKLLNFSYRTSLDLAWLH